MSLNHLLSQSSENLFLNPRFNSLKIDGSLDAGTLIIDNGVVLDGDVEIKGNLLVDGTSEFKGNATADGNIEVKGVLTADGNAEVKGNLIVDTKLTANGLQYPLSDSLNGATLTSNGSGVLSLINQTVYWAQATTMAIPDSTDTIINTFTTQQSSGSGITLSSGQDFKVNRTGFYAICFSVSFNTANNGQRNIEILVNGIKLSRGRVTTQAAAAQIVGPNLTGCLQLSSVANDIINVRVYQDTGGTINIVSADFEFALIK